MSLSCMQFFLLYMGIKPETGYYVVNNVLRNQNCKTHQAILRPTFNIIVYIYIFI